MFIHGFEALSEQLHKFAEKIPVEAAHAVDHFVGEFEGRVFELDSFSGCVAEEEAEVDVDDVAFVVDEDVAVVSVFDLQEVADEGIAGEAGNEVVERLFVFEVLFGSVAEVLQVEVVQRNVADFLFELVDGERVVAHFDEAAVVAG